MGLSKDLWQPVETAPKDEWVLVGPTNGMHICVAMNCNVDGWITETRNDMPRIYTPTHWMPLPEAPE